MRVYDHIFMSERLGCEGFRGLRSTLSFIISPFDWGFESLLPGTIFFLLFFLRFFALYFILFPPIFAR